MRAPPPQALMYGEIAAALLVDALAGKRAVRRTVQVLTAIVVGCWLYYVPWLYCYPLTNDGHQRRRWMKRWD